MDTTGRYPMVGMEYAGKRQFDTPSSVRLLSPLYNWQLTSNDNRESR